MPKWNWPDARGYVAISSFCLAVMVIWMMKIDRSLREDEFFQTIATIIIANGWMAVVSWAFAATKGGGELADKNASIVEKHMNGIKEVEINQPIDKPIPTKETKK